MKSAQEITTRIAEAKQELIGITNPWVATPGQKSPGFIPPVETNELKKAANEKRVLELNAEIKALSWVEEASAEPHVGGPVAADTDLTASPDPPVEEPPGPPEATDLEEKAE